MVSDAERMDLVKQEMIDLLQHQGQSLSEDLPDSFVDKVTLNYLTSIADDLASSNLTCEDFDADAFAETIAAYIPPLAHMDSASLWAWIRQVAAKLEKLSSENRIAGRSLTVGQAQVVGSKGPTGLDFQSEGGLADVLDQRRGPLRDEVGWHARSDEGRNVEHVTANCRIEGKPEETMEDRLHARRSASEKACPHDRELQSDFEDRVTQLADMFGNACSITVLRRCLARVGGDLEMAAQLILDDDDSPTEDADEEKAAAAAPGALGGTLQAVRRLEGLKAGREEMAVKASIVGRYGYLPVSEDGPGNVTGYNPKLTLTEEKKLIRYRNGQIVSTKGERYQEVKKQESDEMKKTYISLKPAKKYRWH